MAEWVSRFLAQFPAATTDTAAFSGYGACAASPDNEAEAAAIIKFAAQHKIPVVPCGGGTSQGMTAPPPTDFLLLSTRGLNKLIHHEPGDMVATAQAGMSVGEFQKAIGARGQWMPIDALPEATIGGIVAANAHGPRSLGYGTLRDMVLGMSVINGDGVLRKCGGKVVKNVTGYSLDKLYIGSQGTLGLITEVTFKLRPAPIDGIFLDAQIGSLNEGLAAMRAIAAKNLPLEMLRLFNFVPGGERSIRLLVGATGTRIELNRILNELQTAAPGLSFKQPKPEGASDSMADASWGLGIAAFGRHREAPIVSGATLRFGCVSTKLDAALHAIEKYLSGFWSLGVTDAIVDINSLSEAEAARICSEFEKLGVNFAFENVKGAKIQNRWGLPRPEWALMRQIKASLDPKGIMNPGRFVV